MSNAWKDEPWEQFQNYFAEMKQLLDQNQSRFSVVIFPIETQLDERLLSFDYNYVLKPQSKLAMLCSKFNVPCLDLFHVFRVHHNRGIRLFRDGLHLNEGGHKLAAKEIYDFLAAARLFPAE